MFEYHGNNLTVDADGVSVTVALAEPLDIEKPLADLDLATGEAVAVGQFVVSRDCLPLYTDESEEEEDRSPDGRHYFINGYIPSDWSDGVDYEGWGNEEVIARAVPFLELGVKGLLAFCSQESQALKRWLEGARIRSGKLEKIAKEHAEAAAAELERLMPKRHPAIAQKELNKFVEENGINYDGRLWREVEGKEMELFLETHGVGYFYGDEMISGPGAIILHQKTPIEKYNGHLGEVRVSKRGYFTAGKNTSLGLLFDGQARGSQEYPTVEDALESLVPYILEGEVDSTWGFNTAPGLPMSPKDDLDS